MNEKTIVEKLLKLAKKAYNKNESPIAALIICNDKIIATAYNKRNKSHKTIDHAEIIAITKANKKLKNWRTNTCTLYCLLEPCDMCKSVISESRINDVRFLVYRNKDKKQYNKTVFNKINDQCIIEEEYTKIIHNFWQNKR